MLRMGREECHLRRAREARLRQAPAAHLQPAVREEQAERERVEAVVQRALPAPAEAAVRRAAAVLEAVVREPA